MTATHFSRTLNLALGTVTEPGPLLGNSSFLGLGQFRPVQKARYFVHGASASHARKVYNAIFRTGVERELAGNRGVHPVGPFLELNTGGFGPKTMKTHILKTHIGLPPTP